MKKASKKGQNQAERHEAKKLALAKAKATREAKTRSQKEADARVKLMLEHTSHKLKLQQKRYVCSVLGYLSLQNGI